MKFYEDQHKLAACLERTGEEWEYTNLIDGEPHPGYTWATDGLGKQPSWYIQRGFIIRPVLRYGLPSHLQSEIHNPDNLTEEQICDGGKYRAAVKSECDGRHGIYSGSGVAEHWSGGNWWKEAFANTEAETIRLPATVPWPDPLADLLKAHGVEVTPEILAALNAWKGVQP